MCLLRTSMESAMTCSHSLFIISDVICNLLFSISLSLYYFCLLFWLFFSLMSIYNHISYLLYSVIYVILSNLYLVYFQLLFE